MLVPIYSKRIDKNKDQDILSKGCSISQGIKSFTLQTLHVEAEVWGAGPL